MHQFFYALAARYFIPRVPSAAYVTRALPHDNMHNKVPRFGLGLADGAAHTCSYTHLIVCAGSVHGYTFLNWLADAALGDVRHSCSFPLNPIILVTDF